MEKRAKKQSYSVDDFAKKQADTENVEDCWTDEAMMAVAKKIMKKLNIHAEIYRGEENGTE